MAPSRVNSPPPITTNTATQPKFATVSPPPQQDQLVRDVAVVLAAGASVAATVAGISAVLAGTGVTLEAIKIVLGLAGRGTAHEPNARLLQNGINAVGMEVKAAKAQELYFRSAYIVQASARISRKLEAGSTIRVALADESLNYRKHDKARKNRLDCAAQTQRARMLFGPLLGWYLNPMLNNELECITADGHNFYAEEGTAIGYPGAVHPNCGCRAGPPIEGAGMVNDALSSILRTGPARKLHLKIA